MTLSEYTWSSTNSREVKADWFSICAMYSPRTGQPQPGPLGTCGEAGHRGGHGV